MSGNEDTIEQTPEQQAASEKQAAIDKWLEDLREKTKAKGAEIANILGCAVDPFIFVVTPMEDAAIGFFRKPDAKQSFKILRSMGETNYENGVELLAKTQLIRDIDLTSRGMEGTASDPRFMDINGKYNEEEDSSLNFNLLKRAGELISLFTDEFKKKQMAA
jgi:hypothetical protein